MGHEHPAQVAGSVSSPYDDSRRSLSLLRHGFDLFLMPLP
jgi:hypothetical protein